jgi:predicted phage terminase large subunit-like protein
MTTERSDLEDPPNSLHLRVTVHDDGPALWPQHIGLASLEESKRDVGTPIFMTMYQGRRGGLAGQIIRDEYFRYFEGIPPGVTYMTVDPAISLKTTADETAIAIANVFEGQIAYRWIWHGRVGMLDTESVIVAAWKYYQPVAIGIEDVAYQTALIQLLEADHPELPIEPVHPTKDKLSRFLGLARLYEFGRIYHHPSMKASAAEYQLTHLPNGRHDDIPDAMTMISEMSGMATVTIVSDERPEGFL